MPAIDSSQMAALAARAASAASTSTKVRHAAYPTTSVTPYTYGLTGVDPKMDNISSRVLYGSVGFICVIVTAVRLFQRGNAHLRHLTSLNSNAEQQVYWRNDQSSWWPWLKKHMMYAPLKNKRHNREIQLSAAVNLCTIPSRLHTTLLVLYYLSNLIYCCMLDYTELNKAAVIAELRGRTGHLSTLNMIALFLMAGRNNPFITVLRVSFDTMNLFHRWIGRLIIVEAIAHTAAWASNKYTATGWTGIGDAVGHNAFIQYGTIGTVAMVIILIQSPSPIRHAAYETFLHIHQLLAFATLLGVFVHAKLGPLPQIPYIILIICIWSYDRIFRLTRLLYRNLSKSRGMTHATVEALPGEACRVTFHMPRPWTPPPGAHVYAYLPSISLWQSHPFSVAWTTLQTSENIDTPRSDPEKPQIAPRATSSTVSLIMAARTGMTRKLYQRASASPSQTVTIPGFLEGSYGGLESLHSYGSLVLFAGGVGITHQLRHVQDLLLAYEARTAAVRRIHLIWIVRSTEQLEWVRPWMDKLLAMPCRRDILRISLYVTKPRSPRDIVSASSRVQMFAGRPKAGVVIRGEFEERVGAMCVGVCGPGALADDVREGAREVVGEGKCDFWEEAFTW
ncbi:MAG: hypothetical protein MMC23_005744 [Stictis urceolatum]|nr:hypothetical protein [Stictis urceolata]